jgi:excisionase family DNA binding protein
MFIVFPFGSLMSDKKDINARERNCQEQSLLLRKYLFRIRMRGMVKGFYTTSEVAAELGITPARVRQLVLDGTLPAEKVGRDLLIKVGDLDTVRSRKTKRGPAPKVQTPKTSKKK